MQRAPSEVQTQILSRVRADGRTDLELLWQDDDVLLCRGKHRWSDGTRTGVLAVVPAAEPTPRSSLDRLVHEYELRDDLERAAAARPLEVLRTRGRALLLLADPGGEPLARLLGRPLETGVFLRIAIGMTAALVRVHELGLIHRDIKPAHFLVDQTADRVVLTGFGMASRVPGDFAAPEAPELIAGTLAYMAPEQTGRMNRSVDARSDLYALGATLYEMITGSPPFTAQDPVELVHCQIARRPVPPAERIPGVSDAISLIVMKLLAKTPQDRYQTAAGVVADMRKCLAQWEASGRIDAFSLGEHDIRGVLRLPEKLYGRDGQVRALVTAFERVTARGPSELVLISGYAGIGKSSIVYELHKVIVPSRGMFASGKFDQYQRDIPYGTLAQAFRALTRQLLVKGDEDLAAWRSELLLALGPNGRLVMDLVPELELLIGPQPPVLDLPAREAENRFLAALEGFLGVFARPEHPLVLFLDDLQWLDAATLKFLARVVSPHRKRHLLAIGAYRDNEVGPTHPLMRTLESLREAGAAVESIALTALSGADVCRLVGDVVGPAASAVEPLGRLVHEKTAGNPFFAIQLLNALREDRLLCFDAAQGEWRWDIDDIRATGFTDNVIDLVVVKLRRLPAETQVALQQFACLGSTAGVSTLASVQGGTEAAVHAVLWSAVREGIVVRSGGTYRFLHDRVQEAAYALIPEDRRSDVHLRIGRLLLSHLPPEEVNEHVLEIVNQLNRGVELITDPDEKETLRQLNALAGRRAKAAIAYVSARHYLAQAAALLPADAWTRQYEDTFTLQLERSECEYVTGNPEVAEALFDELLKEARHALDAARVFRLRMAVYELSGRSERAVDAAVEALKLFGVSIPDAAEEIQAATEAEFQQIPLNLGNRRIADIVETPPATDPEVRTVIGLLAQALSASYMARPPLFPLLTAKAVNLALRRGNTEESSSSYCFYALLLAARFKDIDSAYQFSAMAVRLNEKFNDPRLKGRTLLLHAATVVPWRMPLDTSIAILRQAFRACLDVGDLIFAGYAAFNTSWLRMERGETVDALLEELESFLDFAQESHNSAQHAFLSVVRALLLRLSGRVNAGDDPHEAGHWLRYFRNANDHWGLAIYHTARLVEALIYERIDEALGWAEDAEAVCANMEGTGVELTWVFYHALTLTNAYGQADSPRRRRWEQALARHITKLRLWAEACPESFRHRLTLVLAEVARIEGRQLEAMRLYEQAISLAKASAFVHNEALANELAGRFYLNLGFETNGYAHLRQARACYALWGADGKVRHLEGLYPRLASSENAGPTGAPPAQQLDITAVVRAFEAVSSEIELPSLIETLMTIALQNAGADRGLLILPRADGYLIEAEAGASGDTIAVRVLRGSRDELRCPDAVVRFVMRTQESVIVDDASKPGLFADDPYLVRGHARSVLCLPLVNRGRLAGALYLENTLTSHAFTPSRIALLELLAAQAAISLENTRLYGDLREREAKIRRLVDANIIGIVISDLDGRIIEANDAFLNMVGYSRVDLNEGRCAWTEMTPPEWSAVSQRAVDQIRATGSCEPFEKEYLRKDGSRVPVLVGAAAFEGERTESVAFVLDLTERRRAEEVHQAHLRFLESMDRVNRAIQGTNDLEQMMGDVLNTVLTMFMCDRAILGTYSGHPDATSFSVAMQRTRPEFPGDLVPGVEYAVDDDLQGMIRSIRTTNSPVQFVPGSEQPLSAGVMERFGVQSVLSMAIYPKLDEPRHFYHFSLVQCSDARVWTPGEIRLFQEIGRRLGDALTTLSMLSDLRRSEARLEEAQRIAHVGHWERDMETDRFTLSDETYRILGLQPQERALTFAGFQDWVHADDGQIRQRAMAEILGGSARIDTQYRIVRPSGEVRIVHVQGSVIRDDTGRPRRTFGTIQDVTERQLAAKRLAESEARHRSLARAIGLVWTASADGRVKDDVPEWRAYTGQTREEMAGNRWLSAVHPEDRDRTAAAWAAAVRTLTDYDVDYRIRGADGVYRWFNVRACPVRNADGSAREWAGICIDIDERRKAEEALRRAQAELAQMMRVMTVVEIGTSIAHEVNQPLAAIALNGIACRRWLEAIPPNFDEARAAVQAIIEDSNRASNVIGHIRGMLRSGDPERKPLDVNDLIRETLALMRTELARSDVAIKTDLRADSPLVLADRVLVQQVLVNLILNGKDAMECVDETARVLTLRSRTDEFGGVLVEVQDSGKGLDPERPNRIFDPFYSTKPGGLGMGLSISVSIVKAHQGRLWATSNDGGGATLHFTLPAGVPA